VTGYASCGKKRSFLRATSKRERVCCAATFSRVENRHAVPAIETLEKMARALEIPLYQLFYDGEEPPNIPNLLKRKTSDSMASGSTGKNSIYMRKLVKYLSKSTDSDRKLLLALARKVSGERSRRVSKAA